MKIQTIKSADLPEVLQNIPNPPEKLFSLGEELKNERRITIVGTRKPTPYGREVTEMLARDLTNAGARHHADDLADRARARFRRHL